MDRTRSATPSADATASASHVPTLSVAPATSAVPDSSPGVPSPASDVVAAARDDSDIRSDEVVILFPTLGALDDDGRIWRVDVHGWVFEPEDGSWGRSEIAEEIAEAIGDQEEIVETRVRPFLVDNERGKAIYVQLADQVVEMPRSAKDGHFDGVVELSVDAVGQGAQALPLRALAPSDDARVFETTVHLVPPKGLLLISDVDDTIKVTEVTNKAALLRRTFAQPFEPVDGMADQYKRWIGADGHLHFLSASPWQLFEPLHTLAEGSGFPAATWSLKRWRPSRGQLDVLLADPIQEKEAAITSLADRFPNRQLLLMGDSGEKDPEIYGSIYRSYPDRVVGIGIRNVTDESRDDARFVQAFDDVPAERWVLFNQPAELSEVSW